MASVYGLCHCFDKFCRTTVVALKQQLLSGTLRFVVVPQSCYKRWVSCRMDCCVIAFDNVCSAIENCIGLLSVEMLGAAKVDRTDRQYC